MIELMRLVISESRSQPHSTEYLGMRPILLVVHVASMHELSSTVTKLCVLIRVVSCVLIRVVSCVLIRVVSCVLIRVVSCDLDIVCLSPCLLL